MMEGILCKYCRSPNVVRYGHYRGVPRWWCKDCRRKFADNRALPHMRTSREPVASALHMFYEGLPLDAVRLRLKNDYGVYPSRSTVYHWITGLTPRAIEATAGFRPIVGNAWLVMSKKLRVAGADSQFWDVIDMSSGFLIVTYPCSPDDASAPSRVLESAAERAGRTPKIIVADRPADYKSGTTVGAHALVVPTPEFHRTEQQGRVMANFRRLSMVRDRIVESCSKTGTARLFAQGWLVHYNFFSGNVVLTRRRGPGAPGAWVAVLEGEA